MNVKLFETSIREHKSKKFREIYLPIKVLTNFNFSLKKYS